MSIRHFFLKLMWMYGKQKKYSIFLHLQVNLRKIWCTHDKVWSLIIHHLVQSPNGYMRHSVDEKRAYLPFVPISVLQKLIKAKGESRLRPFFKKYLLIYSRKIIYDFNSFSMHYFWSRCWLNSEITNLNNVDIGMRKWV